MSKVRFKVVAIDENNPLDLGYVVFVRNSYEECEKYCEEYNGFLTLYIRKVWSRA